MATEANRRRRMMARFVGSGYVVFGVVAASQFGLTAAAVDGWFNPVGAVGVFVPGIALLVASLGASMAALDALAVLCVAGYAAAVALWFVAFTGGPVDAEVVSWLTSVTDLPALVVILVRPIWQAGVVLAGSVAARIAILAVGRGGGLDAKAVIDSLNVGIFGAFFLLAFAIALRSGQLFDESRLEALEATSRAAAAAARNAERARFDGVVHDRVIAVLNAVRADPHDPRLAAQAGMAIDALDEVASDDPFGDEEIDVAELIARLRTVVATIDGRLRLQVTDRSAVGARTEGGAEFDSLVAARFPADAIRAIGEAAGEALRNSLLHAGASASRAVTVDVDADSVWVSIVDDGVGFEPTSVAPERLGLRVSVAERMAGVAGGGTTVTSARGEGTVVDVTWRRP